MSGSVSFSITFPHAPVGEVSQGIYIDHNLYVIDQLLDIVQPFPYNNQQVLS